MIEENLRYGDIGFFNTLHSRLVGPYLGEIGNAEQKQRFLPRCIQGDCILAIAMTEPGAGSDLAGMKTRAEDRGDHWLLSGSKKFFVHPPARPGRATRVQSFPRLISEQPAA